MNIFSKWIECELSPKGVFKKTPDSKLYEKLLRLYFAFKRSTLYSGLFASLWKSHLN